MGKRKAVLVHEIELHRLTAGSRRCNGAEKESCHSIADFVDTADVVTGKTKASADISTLADKKQSHCTNPQQKPYRIGFFYR